MLGDRLLYHNLSMTRIVEDNQAVFGGIALPDQLIESFINKNVWDWVVVHQQEMGNVMDTIELPKGISQFFLGAIAV